MRRACWPAFIYIGQSFRLRTRARPSIRPSGWVCRDRSGCRWLSMAIKDAAGNERKIIVLPRLVAFVRFHEHMLGRLFRGHFLDCRKHQEGQVKRGRWWQRQVQAKAHLIFRISGADRQSSAARSFINNQARLFLRCQSRDASADVSCQTPFTPMPADAINYRRDGRARYLPR